jgi:hypothetical protein
LYTKKVSQQDNVPVYLMLSLCSNNVEDKNDSQQGVAAPKKRRIKESGLGMQEKNSPASMQKHCKVPGILIAVPINKW